MKKIILIVIIMMTLTGCDNAKITTTNAPSVIESLPGLDEIENHVADIIEYLDKATFVVYNKQTVEDELVVLSQGSGVIYKKTLNENDTFTYHMITNEHVTKDAEAFGLSDGSGSTATAELVGEDADNDLAILKFTSITEYNAIPFGNEDDLRIGQFVVAMGTPMGSEFYNSATFGIISGFRDGLVQHDAAINSGNSGGPLVDMSGNLIGINVLKLSNNADDAVSIEGMGFAVDIETVKSVVYDLEANDTTIERPILGISVTEVSLIKNILTTYTRESYIAGGGTGENYDKFVSYDAYIAEGIIEGVFVSEISSGFPGDLSGLLVNDVITGVGGISFSHTQDFQIALWQVGVGGSSTLEVNRNGVELTLNIQF